MIDDLDAEVELLLDEIRAASPARWDAADEDAAFCAYCADPDASRSWKGEGVCCTCWADLTERAEAERQERLEARWWQPKLQRIVPLGFFAEAHFVIWPAPRMVVIRRGQATIFLEYFDPTGYTNEALKKKLGVYRIFS